MYVWQCQWLSLGRPLPSGYTVLRNKQRKPWSLVAWCDTELRLVSELARRSSEHGPIEGTPGTHYHRDALDGRSVGKRTADG